MKKLGRLNILSILGFYFVSTAAVAENIFSTELITWKSEKLPGVTIQYPKAWKRDLRGLIGMEILSLQSGVEHHSESEAWTIELILKQHAKSNIAVGTDIYKISGVRGNEITISTRPSPDRLIWVASVECRGVTLNPQYNVSVGKDRKMKIKAQDAPNPFVEFARHIVCEVNSK